MAVHELENQRDLCISDVVRTEEALSPGLDEIGEEKIKGKIVFYNRPMDPTIINTFQAYGQTVNQRTQGAKYAEKYGAV